MLFSTTIFEDVEFSKIWRAVFSQYWRSAAFPAPRPRVRRHDLGNLDEKLFEFYAQRIPNASSVHELNRLIRDCGGPGFLCATEADLTGGTELDFDSEAFPDAVPVELSLI